MKLRLLAGVHLVAMGLAVAGCAHLSTGGSTADQDLSAAIQLRLSQDPIAGRQAVAVSVNQGIATVSGRLSDPGAKARVLSIVRGTPDIQDVVDGTTR